MSSIDLEQAIYLFSLQQSSELFEKLVNCCYKAILKPGDTAVDCGAHKGLHTFPMAEAVGTSGKVHAFEVIPPLVQELRDVIAREKLTQVELHAQAVSSAPGEATFFWVRNGEGLSGLRERDVRRHVPDLNIEQIQVQVTTLDSLPPAALGSWRFCKLDIEGAELDALKGARKSLLKHRPMLVFENGRNETATLYEYSRDQYFDFFTGLGYVQFDLFGRDFGPDQWEVGYIPWYIIAVPAGSADEAFIRLRYPDLLQAVRYACEQG